MDLDELVALARRDAAQSSVPAGEAAHVFTADDVDVDALTARLVAPPLFPAGALIDAAPLTAMLASCARHCFTASLGRAQTEALCEVVAEVLAEDVRVWQRSARTSFAHFQRLLLALSVDRPPRSVALFSPGEAARACEHVLQVYFGNFKLFKACCSTVPSPALSQRSTAAVEEPYAPLPLSHAVMLAERPAAASEEEDGR
jgi:hypothetical protein